MGAGASASTVGCASKGLSTTRVGQECSSGSGSGSTTHLDVVEGGVQWLACAIEAEKREKEWLATKYDSKCEEVKALQLEVMQLRQELREAKEGYQPSGRSTIGGATSSSSQPVASAAHHVTIATPSQQDATSPTSPGGSLKTRRGLKLSVDTPQRGRGARITNIRCDPQPVSPVREETSNPEEDLPFLGQDDAIPPEPMSALLRRRTESDWGPTVCKKKSEKLATLHVAAPKVFSMVLGEEDCPTSPKRIQKSRPLTAVEWSKSMKEREESSGIMTLLAGSGGTA